SLFTHTCPTDPFTLSLHDALPIYPAAVRAHGTAYLLSLPGCRAHPPDAARPSRRYPNHAPAPDSRTAQEWGKGRNLGCCSRIATDRKSTRLNSSHVSISYAVFCLK